MHSLNGLCVIQLKKLLKKNTPNIQTEILVASFSQTAHSTHHEQRNSVHLESTQIQYGQLVLKGSVLSTKAPTQHYQLK